MVGKIKKFFEESRREFKRVNWPSRAETVRYTLFVIVFSLVLSVFLGFLDFAFLKALEDAII
ncbi:MAG TPA: preprotein translocase subunit SecE [Candidatus Paceibacterota bacterium]|nr:preprotein translocase subunit SecE [Candidatus Paceibacterota bacterium]